MNIGLQPLLDQTFIYWDNDHKKYLLKKPVKIQFSTDLNKHLFEIYAPHKEIGGLLISRPILLEDGTRLLEVIDVVPIPSISPDPYEYSMDIEEANEYLKQIISDGEAFIPLTFHTHPVPTDETGLMLFYQQSQPSFRDKRSMFKLNMLDKIFCPPDILVVRDWNMDKLFLGFYDIGTEYGIEYQLMLMKINNIQKIIEIVKDIFNAFVEELEDEIKLLIMGGLILVAGIAIVLYLESPGFRKFIDEMLKGVLGISGFELQSHFIEKEMSQHMDLKIFFAQTRLDEDVQLFIPQLEGYEDKMAWKLVKDLEQIEEGE